jgi:hypothetical protein
LQAFEADSKLIVAVGRDQIRALLLIIQESLKCVVSLLLETIILLKALIHKIINLLFEFEKLLRENHRVLDIFGVRNDHLSLLYDI